MNLEGGGPGFQRTGRVAPDGNFSTATPVLIAAWAIVTGVFQIKALLADTRFHQLKGGSNAWGAFVIGFAFAFGWTPCVGPILA